MRRRLRRSKLWGWGIDSREASDSEAWWQQFGDMKFERVSGTNCGG